LTSAVATRPYELKVPAPTLSLATNTYNTDQSVTEVHRVFRRAVSVSYFSLFNGHRKS
jgi:hypothetical protein